MSETKKPGRPRKQPEETSLEEAVTKKVVLRGRGGINNFGNNTKELVKTAAQRAIAKQLLQETLQAYKQPKVKSDEELAQRISDYFTMCAETGQIPTVEEMALSTGYSVATVWDWEKGRNKGFSDNTSEIIKKAKSFMQTFDSKLVTTGALNFLTYCFRAKNYYGMVDKTEVVIAPQNPLGPEASPEELKERYKDIIIDDYVDKSEGDT